MKRQTTNRGFAKYEFTDSYGSKCSLQESSNVVPHIWLGVDEIKGEIMASDAIKLGLDTGGKSIGWVDYHIPEKVVLNNRMHLTREQVLELLPYLQEFAEGGEI